MFRRKELDCRCAALLVPVKHANKDSQVVERYRLSFKLCKWKNANELAEEDTMQTEKGTSLYFQISTHFQKFHFSYVIFVFKTTNIYMRKFDFIKHN